MSTKTPKPLRLVVGGYYRRRDGEVVGPVDHSGVPFFPWKVGSFLYSKDGFDLAPGAPSPRDLTARVPKPRTAKPKPEPKGRAVWLVAADRADNGNWYAARSSAERQVEAYGSESVALVRVELPARKVRRT